MRIFYYFLLHFRLVQKRTEPSEVFVESPCQTDKSQERSSTNAQIRLVDSFRGDFFGQ